MVLISVLVACVGTPTAAPSLPPPSTPAVEPSATPTPPSEPPNETGPTGDAGVSCVPRAVPGPEWRTAFVDCGADVGVQCSAVKAVPGTYSLR
jgi:hypothetical protein